MDMPGAPTLLEIWKQSYRGADLAHVDVQSVNKTTTNVRDDVKLRKKVVIQPVDLARLQVAFQYHCDHGHVAGEPLRKLMAKGGIHLTVLEIHEATRSCPPCAAVKFPRDARIKTPAERPDQANKVWSADYVFVGPSTILLKTDRATKMLHASVLQSKRDAIPLIEEYLEDAKLSHSGVPKRIHTDSEAIFKDPRFRYICRKHGVKHKTQSAPGQQDKNGDVESEVKGLKHKLRINAMADLPAEQLLPYSLAYAVLQTNLTPRRRLQLKTPWELYHAHDPIKAQTGSDPAETEPRIWNEGHRTQRTGPNRRRQSYRP
mmetsp:Transcript_31673/g.101511  ORF Transcript_31673/g.101511 Transcript_31673/m.101511 type:complete len:317 (+) Transcript_31673:1229-2179(+)